MLLGLRNIRAPNWKKPVKIKNSPREKSWSFRVATFLTYNFQDLKKRLDEERLQRHNADNTAIKLMSDLETMRKTAKELRKEETR